MHGARVTRRSMLRAAAYGTAALALPFVRRRRAAAADAVPAGRMTLAWHTNIPSRWVDPQQHDGTATPDNFLREPFLDFPVLTGSGNVCGAAWVVPARYWIHDDVEDALDWPQWETSIPRAGKWQDVFPSALTTGYAYPWEDIELNEMATAAR